MPSMVDLSDRARFLSSLNWDNLASISSTVNGSPCSDSASLSGDDSVNMCQLTLCLVLQCKINELTFDVGITVNSITLVLISGC